MKIRVIAWASGGIASALACYWAVKTFKNVAVVFIDTLNEDEDKADIDNMRPRYIAQFQSSEQFSPDDWKVVTPAMMATDEKISLN